MEIHYRPSLFLRVISFLQEERCSLHCFVTAIYLYVCVLPVVSKPRDRFSRILLVTCHYRLQIRTFFFKRVQGVTANRELTTF